MNWPWQATTRNGNVTVYVDLSKTSCVTDLVEGLGAFSLDDEGDFTWLMYTHADGARCAVAQIDCPAVLETLSAVLENGRSLPRAEGEPS